MLRRQIAPFTFIAVSDMLRIPAAWVDSSASTCLTLCTIESGKARHRLAIQIPG